MKFPSSGTVRLQWTYPTGDALLSAPNVEGQTIDSRTFKIKVRLAGLRCDSARGQ